MEKECVDEAVVDAPHLVPRVIERDLSVRKTFGRVAPTTNLCSSENPASHVGPQGTLRLCNLGSCIECRCRAVHFCHLKFAPWGWTLRSDRSADSFAFFRVQAEKIEFSGRFKFVV